MAKGSIRMRQVMDWRAAFLAGVIAGVVMLILQLTILPLMTGTSPWVALRFIVAIGLGEGVLPPPVNLDAEILVVALLLHFVFSILATLVIAFVIHRWGLLVGIVGGALLGLALYAINYYTFLLYFPWFFPMRSWIALLAHIIFGAIAGGTYEALERDEFIEVTE